MCYFNKNSAVTSGKLRQNARRSPTPDRHSTDTLSTYLYTTKFPFCDKELHFFCINRAFRLILVMNVYEQLCFFYTYRKIFWSTCRILDTMGVYV